MEIVESIPTGLTFDHGPKSTSTDEAWLELIKSAEKSIRIASFYWTLRSSDYPTAIKVRIKIIFKDYLKSYF